MYDPFAITGPLPAHSPLGASSADRWMSCPGSVTLSALVKGTGWYQDDDPDYRRDGTQAHALAAHCLDHGLDAWEGSGPDFPELTVDMMAAVQSYLDYVRAQPGEREVEVRVHLPEFHEMFFGTLDCITVECTEEGEPIAAHVIDYKHGIGIPVDVENNVQLMYYAYGKIARRNFGNDTPIKLTIAQPRAPHRHGPIRSWETTVGHIRKWAMEELRPAMEATKDAEYLSLGEWCRFCPAKLVCPAMDGLVNKALHSHVDSLTFTEARMLKMVIKAVDERTMHRLLAGEDPEEVGAKLVKKRSNRVFKGGAPIAQTFGDDAWEKSLKGPASIEKLPGGKAFVAEYAFMPESTGVTVAPLDDPKPEAVRPMTLAEKYGKGRK